MAHPSCIATRRLAQALVLSGLGLAAALLSGCDEVCEGDDRWYDGQCRSSPPSCGDPAPACGDCDAPGAFSYCPFPSDCRCECPTGDAGCPCWDASHCRGRCLFATDDCYDHLGQKAEGTCSETAPGEYGCICEIRSGKVTPSCYD